MIRATFLLVSFTGGALALSAFSNTGSNGAPNAEPSADPTAAPAPSEPATPVALCFGDADGDGLDDALVVSPEGRIALLRNEGRGQFLDITLPGGLAGVEGASCALFADFDGDGAVDLFLGSSEKRLWRNLGGASFLAVESGVEHDLVDWSASAVDHDRDGRLDLLVHTEAGDLLYRNTGESRFERVELPGSGVRAHAPSIAIDEDSEESDSTESANISPTRRRLRNWMRARNAAAGGSSSAPLANSPNSSATNVGNLPLAGLPGMICAGTIVDQATMQCIHATSTPTLGSLYPLSTAFNVNGAGSVGIGTASPSSRVHVKGANGGEFRVFDFTPGGGTQLVSALVGAPNAGPQMRFEGAGSGFIDIGQDSAGSFVVEGSDAPRLTVTEAGDVGIGTPTPVANLHVSSTGGTWVRVTGNNPAYSLESTNPLGRNWSLFAIDSDLHLRDATAGVNRFTISPTGNVGIGTTSAPGANLHVSSTGNTWVRTTGTNPSYFLENTAPSGRNWSLYALGSDLHVRDSTGGANRFSITAAGRVGINTTPASSRFEVFDDAFASIRIRGTSNSNPAEIYFDKEAVGAQHKAAMGYRPANGAFVWVNGADRLTIDTAGLVSVKQSLEIRGGADIVERFESSCGALEPGTVVAIDPEHPGKLACSSGAYDTKVAGVVSGAGGVQPGLCLSQDGMLDGDTPVAMNGRVYVKCTASNGAIKPGDRLTTADLAGHAMKVSDEQRSIGAVIGKAMSSLESGEGLVLVLVNLQ